MDFALRFKSMEKAVTDVIIPALQDSHGLAIEQAHFLLFHLRLMGAQFDKDLHLQLAELREIGELTRALLDAVGQRDDPATREAHALLSESDPIASLVLPSRERIIGLTNDLKMAADALLRRALADKDADHRRSATELSMSYAERDIRRRRVWMRDAGYDLETDALPSLEEVLK